MKKHNSKTCVRNLLDKKKETMARVKDLEKRKKQLLIGLINGENTRENMNLEAAYSALAEQTAVFDQGEPDYDYFPQNDLSAEWLSPLNDMQPIRSRLSRFLDRAVEESSE